MDIGEIVAIVVLSLFAGFILFSLVREFIDELIEKIRQKRQPKIYRQTTQQEKANGLKPSKSNLQAEYENRLNVAKAESSAQAVEQTIELEERANRLERMYAEKCAQLERDYTEKKVELEKMKSTFLSEFREQENEFKKERQTFHINESYLKKEKVIFDNAIKGLQELIEKQCACYPALAGIMADILTAHYEKTAYILEKKKRPALNEAKRIRDLQEETKIILKEKKILEYELAYIRQLFPNIDDIFDTGFTSNQFELETESTTDRTRLFLSPQEYSSLSVTERNQLALDRYISSRKSRWEVGRDFEMYIGYLCEQEGWIVQYSGILENLEDMGRDLIIKKDLKTVIIQCKNWAKSKIIHEKHIFQLYGTTVLYQIAHPFESVKAVFISTTELSKTAKDVADHLSIHIIYHSMNEFPRIKCNINRQTGERIYHLPFDQQYETAIISKRDGEFYAMTVAEAEKQGFRRAFKHKGI